MELFHHLPTRNFQLIDLSDAREAVQERMKTRKAELIDLYDANHHATNTRSAKQKLEEAIKDLSLARITGVMEGDHTIVVTDYPPQQRGVLLRLLDTFIPRLNQIFGYDDDALVLPRETRHCTFCIQKHLGRVPN